MSRKHQTIYLAASCVLLMSFVVQSDFARRLSEKLAGFYFNEAPAKVHLTFNLPRYLAGDTAFYKVHVLSANGLAPVPGRHVLDIALFSNDRRTIYRSKVLVVNGTGFNQIPIPRDVGPGRYGVIARSDGATDRAAALQFEGVLWIVGPTIIREKPTRQELSFHPEGGKLIAGITNKVVVTGVPSTRGGIYSDAGEEVANFEINAHGLGLFFLMPVIGRSYHASTLRTDPVMLPPVDDDGVGLLVSVPANLQPIRVTVQIPERSAYKSEHLIVAMTAHDRVLYTASVSFAKNNYMNLSFPQRDLLPGIARFTIFKEDGTALSERLVFIQPSKLLEPTVSLPKDTFSTRDLITLRIKVRNDERLASKSSLAVSVYHKDLDVSSDTRTMSLASNVWVYSDLTPGAFSRVFLDVRESQAINDFLVTQTWPRYTWPEVWSHETAPASRTNLLSLRGRAMKRDGSVLPNPTTITFLLQKSVLTYTIDLDSSGRFDFPVLMDFYGKEEIFFVAEHKGKQVDDVWIQMEEQQAIAATGSTVELAAEPELLFKIARQQEKIRESYSYHLSDRVQVRPMSLNALLEEEVFGPDISVNLSDYVLFSTMPEMLREIVPMLQYRKRKHSDAVRMFFDDRKMFAGGPPLFVIDGVITDNTSYFLNLAPEQLVSIKLIYSQRKLQPFGSIGRNGIVLVETKIPNHENLIPRSENSLSVRGLERISPSHYQNYIEHDERVPDLRMNLYWNPDVDTDSSGSATLTFQASDVTGSFRVVVEGFADGLPVLAEEDFEVAYVDN